jgi:hypothetical protein
MTRGIRLLTEHAAWSETFSEMFAQVAGVFGKA